MTDNDRIELEALITEREGMIALNYERMGRGFSLAYDETAFLALADRIRALKRPEPTFKPFSEWTAEEKEIVAEALEARHE